MSNENQEQLSVFSPFNTKTRICARDYFASRPVMDYVFKGVLAGSVAGIVAPGSTGKGFFSLGICFDMYTGKDLLGLEIPKLSSGQRVAFVTAEDQGIVIGDRIHSLIQEYSMTSDEVVQMDDTVHFISIAGEVVLNLVDNQGRVNFDLANQMINEYKGYRLIFLDTLARTHTANENDNGHMSILISVFEYIAKHSGAALVFMHHTNKGATLNGNGGEAGAARGAAAITDNIRCQLNLSKISEDDADAMNIPNEKRHLFLWLHNSKINYAEGGADKLYERSSETGVLKAVKNPRSFGYVDGENFDNE